jgi:hypothetical protein
MAPLLTDVNILKIDGTNDYKEGTLLQDIKIIDDQLAMVTTQRTANVDLNTKNPDLNTKISIPRRQRIMLA